VELDASRYIDDEDDGDEPVDNCAKRRPPPRIGIVVTALLMKSFSPWPA